MTLVVKDIFYPSSGKGIIHACRWEPEGAVRGVVQIVHGIAEYAKRYDEFAQYLNSLGYLVVAEDHMGHGRSGGKGCVQGYFHGGWFAAVSDSYQLLESTKTEFPDLPYILFGHSMGSFMVRTMLIRYPECGIQGAIICGTGWMPDSVLQAGHAMAKLICRMSDDKKSNSMLHSLMFGAYNKRVEHKRTAFDWLNRNDDEVDAYIADPLCGFPETAGLAKDMLEGIIYIQNEQNISKMNTTLPVFFIAGGDDPVGDYGKSVRKTAQVFQQHHMDVACRVYPLCRHEILKELNKQEIFEDISQWLTKTVMN